MITHEDLHRLLKTMPTGRKRADLEVVSRVDHPGFEEMAVHVHAAHGPLPGTLLMPRAIDRPVPAILYCHAHGNRYEIGASELMRGRPALQDPPPGPTLARAGYAVLCIDMAGFGARRSEGSENELAKAALWRGGTMMGDMLTDLTLALSALSTLEGIDASRIATLGISMGATHAYWLAALDGRVAACAHMCAFADVGPLIDAAAHDLHGIYMTVPGLLEIGDMGDVAALIAPRPQWIGAGLSDPLTPQDALDPALATVQWAYDAAGAGDRLTIHVDPQSGHEETAAMRREMLAFLATTLQR